ncbi:hypothetical protein JCM19294_1260 [Nonlabens tegetincola]|uniref:Uncharacterized protein n=1 Tax=Nonlabens tegetincola TaxID=323273 RepID=A0A090Q2A3_9FLAO|nr:hypothetical protein JCM19294_1260 [Nonlabens tegetincola]
MLGIPLNDSISSFFIFIFKLPTTRTGYGEFTQNTQHSRVYGSHSCIRRVRFCKSGMRGMHKFAITEVVDGTSNAG